MNRNVISITSPVMNQSPSMLQVNEMSYAVRCHSCEIPFDAMSARWCDCLKPLRTLVCPRCQTCFCTAPLPYKHRLWEGAPRELKEDSRRFRVQIGAQGVPATATPSSQVSGRRPVVLVVDDDEAIRSLVACFVEQLGYRTISTGDAEEALAICATTYVDVVVTDALMPKMDGRELSRRLKATPEGATRKVILMTSVYKARRFRNEAFDRFGIDEFLDKPLDLNTLARTLERFAPLRGRRSAESRLMQSFSEDANDSGTVSFEQRKQSA
jgi:CheY-like chemotaxis protein